MNIRKDSAIFKKEVARLKGLLPRGYVMLLKTIKPELKDKKDSYFYSVTRGVTTNWEMLKELRKITGVEEMSEEAKIYLGA